MTDGIEINNPSGVSSLPNKQAVGTVNEEINANNCRGMAGSPVD